ncbi:inactive pancreatic lipase-related protein 1-like isoform X2 [Hyla sarda]|uniref:inactive pancreatic lipase-related protein 1-like isoform X1 n=1 Tax=Hyla sarda TaxID=327740 RepID=UPI0024C3AC23|nr:inactive pancreatic lipase-related protein 1-like isoform X1 [Hyla sarda]XP_056385907.1 inactive pancreatic lipase-related protein 1-like isoform X1 [Hyla sarda]XP_056385908.1 inactive pancreatic lipase-related protein 1-like isoform X2 [Hyla sarda]
MLLSCALILSFLGAVTGWWMCYSEDECYSDSYPFSQSPERPFPAMPIPISLRWFLYTRCHQDQYQEIFPTDVSSFSSSRFDFEKRTIFIVHGYTQSGQEPWIINMCQKIFEVEDVNCVALDWSSGAFSFYAQASNHVRYVGRQIARFLQMLEETFNYSAIKVHLIGHSLGAHIVGFAGKSHKLIGRITGLDPANPYFEGTDIVVRLDKTDAIFVDIIHTDSKPFTSLGLGFRTPIGHVDVYPNKGVDMPECQDVPAIREQVTCLLFSVMGPINCSESLQAMFSGCGELVKDVTLTPDELKEKFGLVFCSHFQSIQYYTESITNPEKYKANPCNSLEDCLQGLAEPCLEGCQYMGHHARPPPSPEPQTYTLTTV